MPFSLSSLLDALFITNQRPWFATMVHQYIYGVVESLSGSRPIEEWTAIIIGTLPSHDDSDRLSRLQSCQAVRVEHYRAQRPVPHELVAVHLMSGNDERINEGKADSRVMVFREKLSEASSSLYQFIVFTSPLIRGTSREDSTKGRDTRNTDHVTIGSSIQDVIGGRDKYILIQALNVPSRRIDIIHCAALTISITRCANDCSVHHMCIWWVAIFFQTSIRLGGPFDIEQGPLYSQRGKVGSVHLVNDECSLLPLLSADTATLEKDVVQDGQEGIDKVKEETNHAQHPVQHMLSTCNAVSASIQATLKSKDEKLEEVMRKAKEDMREVEEDMRKVEEDRLEVEIQEGYRRVREAVMKRKVQVIRHLVEEKARACSRRTDVATAGGLGAKLWREDAGVVDGQDS